MRNLALDVGHPLGLLAAALLNLLAAYGSGSIYACGAAMIVAAVIVLEVVHVGDVIRRHIDTQVAAEKAYKKRRRAAIAGLSI